MIKTWKSLCAAWREERFFIRTSLAGMLLALGFWGVAFPQYLFTGDCVKIYDEAGNEGMGEAGNLYREIGTAKPGQIEVKIGILEWADR